MDATDPTQAHDRNHDELVGIARFSLRPDKVAEFKRLSAQCMEIVRTHDTGTLSYGIYLTEDETEAVVVERYRDSAALTEHLSHIGDDLMQAVLATASSVHGETLGHVSEAHRQRMENSPVRMLAPYLRL